VIRFSPARRTPGFGPCRWAEVESGDPLPPPRRLPRIALEEWLLRRKRIVLICVRPHLLRELLASIVETDPGVELAGDFDDCVDVVHTAIALEADFVVCDAQAASFEGAAELLRALPRAKLLTVLADGRQSFLYELRPHSIPLGEACPQTLLEAIHGVVPAAGG
jgi:hypothetical protein